MMEGVCVACGEVGEGKPLYKKLGTNHLKIEVYDALIQMQLLSLPEKAKTDCYICWDCDETIADEYISWVETERKRESDDIKRKEQDVARNQKLNKKLTQAFKKAHKESLMSKGDVPPVSQYKQKQERRLANRYYASNCLLCKNPFKSSKTGFLRFNMKKMIDDDSTVYEVLQKLGNDLVLESNLQMRRYICCQCYNKVRRNYKSNVKSVNSNLNNHIPPHSNGVQSTENASGAIKKFSFDEHAAEIAKLIPPGLAHMYKVIEDAPKPHIGQAKEVNVLDDLSYTESDSDSSDDSVGVSRIWNPKASYPPKIPTIRTHIPKSSSQKETNLHTAVEDGTCCAVCGLFYNYRPKSFWVSLLGNIPSISDRNVTVLAAIQSLDIRLVIEKKIGQQNQYVCKPCISRISISFKSTTTKNNEKSYYTVDKSILKVKEVESNGYQSNKFDNIPRPLSVKRRLARSSNIMLQSNRQSFLDYNCDGIPIKRRYNVTESLSNSCAVPRRYSMNNLDLKKDLELLTIINKSEQLRYKGKLVQLKSVDVNLIDITNVLKDHPRSRIYMERIQDVYLYSNFMRSVRNKFQGTCILCYSEVKDKHCRWLEDPVNPPHLMVPLRWARLSLGPPDENTNLSVYDGKVCTNCYNYVKIEFMKFVKNKIGLSMDDGKVSLKKFKVSFDSLAMSVVADPLIPFVDSKRHNSYNSHSAGSNENITENEIFEYDQNSDYKRTTLSSNKKRPIDNIEKRVDQLKKSKGNEFCSHEDSGASELINKSGQQSADSFDSDSESISSSISNCANNQITPNHSFKHISNIPIIKKEHSKTDVTEFKPMKNGTPSKETKDCTILDKVNNNSSPRMQSGMKRKRNSFINESEDISDTKRCKLNNNEQDNIPVIRTVTENRKRLFEDDQFEDDYFQSSEDSVAPFAQRKKIRTAPATVNITEDVTQNDNKNINKTWENIWQILQGISIDCLLSSNELQPVKPENFTHGFLCALNFIKDEIGANDVDVVQWLCKVFPTEFRDLGRKLCKESVMSYLQDMYIKKEHIKIDMINDSLPLSFYTPLIKKSEDKCYLENVLDVGYRDKERVDWHYYLYPVKMDNLIEGKADAVRHEEFNSGLVYALWRANEFLGGRETTLMRWFSQISPEKISRDCFQILAKNAKNSHRFIADHPSILLNLNVPIIVSSMQLQQVVFLLNTSNMCYISRSLQVLKKSQELTINPTCSKIIKNPVAIETIDKSVKSKQICKIITTEEIPRPELTTSVVLHDLIKQKHRDMSSGYFSNFSQESSSSLLRVAPKDRAVSLASTSKGNPISLGHMHLLPVVQPSGIITLVPMQMPHSSPFSELSDKMQNNSFPMSLGSIPPIVEPDSFPNSTSFNNNSVSRSMSIRINNNDQLNRRVEELERKLLEIETKKANNSCVDKKDGI